MQRLLSIASMSLLVALLAVSATAQSLKPVPAAVQQFVDQGGSFFSLPLFSDRGTASKDIEKVVVGAQFLHLELSDLQTLMATQPEALLLSLPYQGETVEVELKKIQLLTPDFQVITSKSDGQPVASETGLHYRGRIAGESNSLAAFSFFPNEVMGMLSDDRHGDRVLGRIDIQGNVHNYILYADANLKAKNAFSCEAIEVDNHGHDDAQSSDIPEVNGCVRVYIEADNELFINKGTVANTTNYLTGLFNQVATLYANETISTQISTIFVWTTADSYSNTSSSTALNQFRTLRTTFSGDIAHLASLGGNNLGGVAYVDVLCDNAYRYAYSNISASYSTVPTYSWSVEVMTHEMGHNLGSRHTQWCGWTGGALDNCYTTETGCLPGPAPTNGGTIMSYCHLTSYGINFNNGFGTQPGNKIRTEVSTATCLASTCSTGGSCGTPAGLSATSVTQTSATLNWGAVSGATSYNLQWKAASNSTWTTVSGLTGTSYNLSALTASTAYNFQVQANCGGTLGTYSTATTFSTAGASCSDSNEPNNTRTAAKTIPVNTNISAQIASATDNDWYRFSNTTSTRNIKINLTNLPADYDVKLYRSSTQVAVSQNDGTLNEQIIYNTSTVSTSYYAYVYGYNGAFSNTQCYTLRVSPSATAWTLAGMPDDRSDETTFEIPVVFENAGFGMYPNPADASLMLEIPVVEENAPVSVTISDVSGRLLLQQQSNLSKTDNRLNINLNEMANGVYFVQVRNGDRQHTRKLVVQH
ncbi:MAG: T9SS type A sorting domain-containing protein [Saprospiraceae bacterium]|nr:T9SS type A sorting domain-containing protein [Saprospiraceae bacterium]